MKGDICSTENKALKILWCITVLLLTAKWERKAQIIKTKNHRRVSRTEVKLKFLAHAISSSRCLFQNQPLLPKLVWQSTSVPTSAMETKPDEPVTGTEDVEPPLRAMPW